MNLHRLHGGSGGRVLAGAFALVTAFIAHSACAADTRPDPAAFFQNPSMTEAQLSPDGKTLAILSAPTAKDRVRLIALDVKTMQPTVLAQYTSSDVAEVHWISDHRLVYALDDRQVSQGELHAASGLYAINIDGSYSRQLFNQHWAHFYKSSVSKELMPWYTRFIGPAGRRNDPDEVYVAEPARRDETGTHDYKLKRLNTISGRVKDVETPIGAEGWLIDADGEPRVTITYRDGRATVMLRDAAADHAASIAEFDAFTATDGLWPELIDDDNRLFVTTTNGRDTRSLYTYDVVGKALSDKPFLQSDRYDLAPSFVMRHGKVLGIRYVIDTEVTRWLDPGMAALQAKVDALLPATVNRIDVPTESDARIAVVTAWSDRVPGRYYLYDTEHGKLTALGSQHPEVDPERMSAMEPMHYAARDGLQIPAWLTVPQGAERKQLPLVVLVHGGPFMRGEQWQWNPEVQFLAARGYAVLEPEYRGSMGYGAALFKAGWKQWGLAMQDDVADGVKWAVAQGLADPKRVCIAGASYGGYAVLMGLVNDPQVYRCGIDWVGVTDIDLIYTASWSDLSTAYSTYGMPTLIGDRTADAAQLKATSPILNAGKIHAPLLMAYGGKDRRVPLVHGEKMHDALARQPAADVQWVVYDDEGHGWRAVSTRIDFWSRAATFLDKNIGPP
ncbi:MAG: alpha/beta fold hydrolase [Betaproteobacteria bacterium]